jgi:STE24 endopeptidase
MGYDKVHIFTILAMFPAFLHTSQFLWAFDFSKAVCASSSTIVAFLLFQVHHYVLLPCK